MSIFSRSATRIGLRHAARSEGQEKIDMEESEATRADFLEAIYRKNKHG